MQRQLAAVPVARRRQAAIALSLLAVLLLVVGVLPWTAPSAPGVRVSAVAALLAGVLVAFIAWGLIASVGRQARETAAAELDGLLAEAAGGCDCGHDHSAELHGAAPAEASCPSPSGEAGHECNHTCDACVLSQLR